MHSVSGLLSGDGYYFVHHIGIKEGENTCAVNR
jgi:hypothetical protein